MQTIDRSLLNQQPVQNSMQLQALAEKGQLDSLEEFLNSQLNIDEKIIENALFAAVKNAKPIGEHSECVRSLLRHYNNVNISDRNGKTLLMYAAEKADIEITKILLQYKAKVDVKDKNNFTALFYLITNPNKGQNIDLLTLLLNENTSIQVNSEIQDRMTPLLKATALELSKVVEALLINGAEVNHQLESTGDTSLHIAIRNHNMDICQLLMQHEADFNKKNKKKQSPMDIVQDKKDIKELLMSYQRKLKQKKEFTEQKKKHDDHNIKQNQEKKLQILKLDDSQNKFEKNIDTIQTNNNSHESQLKSNTDQNQILNTNNNIQKIQNNSDTDIIVIRQMYYFYN